MKNGDASLFVWESIGELGTIKTLRRDDEGMRIMAILLADFITQQSHFVNANLDDFNWKGEVTLG